VLLSVATYSTTLTDVLQQYIKASLFFFITALLEVNNSLQT